MRLTITTNWADDFIDRVSEFDEVEWIRGRLYRDEIGGQLPIASFSKRPTRKTVEKAIKRIHSIGKKFSYTIDSHCLENREYTWEGQKRMLEQIKWIYNSGADAVGVAIPHLVEVIRGQFARLKIDFGTSRIIGEMQRIKYFDKLGVDSIAIRTDYNRNFALLKLFRKSVKCRLKLIPNSLCLYHCNFANDHENLLSHVSNSAEKNNFSRYYNHVCNYERLDSLEEIIKSPFIRPEDLKVYESCGYEDFILEPNSANTDDIMRTVKTYISGDYKGNLLELLSLMGERPFCGAKGKVAPAAPYLDNKQMDGFLQHFIQGDGNHCLAAICGLECAYCKQWVKKAIRYPDKDDFKRLCFDTAKSINMIEDGVYL